MVVPYVGDNAPATKSAVVVPSATVDLPFIARALTLNVGGAVSYIGIDDVTYTTNILPIGNYPLFAKRILIAGTTASVMTAWG